MIDLFLDAMRGEMAMEGAGGAGLPLSSPFSSQQPSSRHLQYHTPARFSKEVVQGIRHAAGKLFKVGHKPLGSSSATSGRSVRVLTHVTTVLLVFSRLRRGPVLSLSLGCGNTQMRACWFAV